MNKFILFKMFLVFLTLSCTNLNKGRLPASQRIVNDFDIDLVFNYLVEDIQKFEENRSNTDFKVKKTFLTSGPKLVSVDEYITNPKKMKSQFFNLDRYEKFYKDFYVQKPYEYDDWTEAEELLHSEYKLQNMMAMKNLFDGNRISQEMRKTLIEILTVQDVKKGDYLNPISILNFLAMAVSVHNFVRVTNADLIREAILAIPKKIKGVSYNGTSSRMEFSDKELEKNVNIIAFSLYENKLKFREVFFKLPPDVQAIFRKNTYSGDDAKIEAFDLIMDKFSALMYLKFIDEFKDEHNLDLMPFKRMVKKAMVQAFLVKPKDDIYGWENPNLNILKSEENISFLCANGIAPSPNEREFDIQYQDENGYPLVHPARSIKESSLDGILEYWTFDSSIMRFIGDSAAHYKVVCGTETYDFAMQKIPMAKIPEPDPFVAKDNTNVLMTLALVDEIGSAQKELIKTYLTLKKGWKVYKDFELVDTKRKFSNLFPVTDIYFPVSHSMEVNHFLVGTGKSNYLILYKEFKGKNNEVRHTYFHLLLPAEVKTAFSKSVVLSGNELAELYKQRRDNGYASLFLMNLSCSSSQTLFTWTQVYRQSVELEVDKDMSKYKDLPYIIGADRGFETDGFFNIAKLVDFPLGTIKLLQETENIRQVINFLDKPIGGGMLSSLSKFLKLAGSQEDEVPDYEGGNGFSPVYNLDNKRLLEYGGFKLKVTNGRTEKTINY